MMKFCLRDTAGSPERARWRHLARSGSQSQRAVWFILPAHGASHIIIIVNYNFHLRGFFEIMTSITTTLNQDLEQGKLMAALNSRK